MGELLEPDRIDVLLEEFIRRLGETGEHYDGVVVGGAALALQVIPDRIATQDVDTFGQLSEAAMVIIKEMAVKYDLPPNWLNSRAQHFKSVVVEPTGLAVLHEHNHARLRLMDNETLLALKLRAGRISKDADDIRALMNHLGIKSLAQAEGVVAKYRDGEEEMANDARFIVEQHLAGL